MLLPIVLLLLYAVMGGVSGGSSVHDNTNTHHVFRETRVSLPQFTPQYETYGGNGAGNYALQSNYYYGGFNSGYYRTGKTYKKSKKSYKSEKSSKKDKSQSYYSFEAIHTSVPKPVYKVPKPVSKQTRIPTLRPSSSPVDFPTNTPNIFPTDSSASEDCPPARPPAVIPPSPNVVLTEMPRSEQPHSNIDDNIDKSEKFVEIELNAIDYTLLRNDDPPLKDDFLELNDITASYFKDYMLDAYEVSTQANLADFTTVFVTAHFRPGDPVHVQYKSTAFFSVDSVNIPSSDTLNDVLEQSLNDPQPYIAILKDELSESNPFSTTTDAFFTDPRETPATTRTFLSSQESENVIKIASAAAGFTILIAAFLFLRRGNEITDETYIDTQTKCGRRDAVASVRDEINYKQRCKGRHPHSSRSNAVRTVKCTRSSSKHHLTQSGRSRGNRKLHVKEQKRSIRNTRRMKHNEHNFFHQYRDGDII